MNFLTLIFGLQNLRISVMFFLFEEDTNPVWDPTSNGVTDGVTVRMSDKKCWYLSNLSLLDISILCSAGTVSSKMDTVFCFLSIITISGFLS